MSYALITGASSGIGRCYAKEMAHRGYNIVAVSNQEEALSNLRSELVSAYDVVVETICCDLAREEAAQQLYERCKAEGWQVDVLICNAGMLLFSTLVHTEPARLNTIIALHCTTTTLLCRYFGEDMKRRGAGHILIMSSATAWLPYPTISHYAATKAYLKSFGQSLWYEMRGRGVSITTLFPSAVDTPFYNLDDKMRRRLLWWGLMLSAEDVARKALRAMFRRRRKCLPGFWTKLEAAVCALLPAWVLLPIMKIPAVKKILERV